MKTYLPLVATSLFPVLCTLLIYFAQKKTPFRKLPYMARQAIIGVVFGGLAILPTTFGIDLGGAEVNSRDASILSAGLIFGGPAGIIAGLIGGIHRFVITLWGIGEYTGIACSIASIVAGLLTGCMRKIVFDNRMPNWIYSFVVAVTTESLHMLLIFMTNMRDIYTAFEYVKSCALPMTICTALSVTVSVILISLFSKERAFLKPHGKKITQIFHTRLFVCFLIMFAIFCTFTFSLGKNIALNDSKHLLNLNLNDAKIVADEIYTNIVSYSNATLAKITLSKEENTLILKFRDNGIPYNPLQVKSPDVTLPSQERKVGGLGIHLVKNISDEVTYSHSEGINILTVKIDFD